MGKKKTASSTKRSQKESNKGQADSTLKDTYERRRKVFLWFGGLLGSVLLLAAIALGLYDQYLSQYKDKFYPGISVAGVEVAGMTYNDALDLVQEKVDLLYTVGIPIEFPDAPKEAEGTVSSSSSLLTPDIVPLSLTGTVQSLYAVDIESSLDQAYAIGREGSIIRQLREQLGVWRKKHDFALAYEVDRDFIAEYIKGSFEVFETKAKNASISIEEDGSVKVVPEESGFGFDYEAIVDQAVAQIHALDPTTIEIKLTEIVPEVTAADVAEDLAMIDGLLDRSPVPLSWESNSWEYPRQVVGHWLSYSSEGELAIDAGALEETLTKPASVITVEAQEGRWQIEKDEGGNAIGLTQTSEAQEGRTIDYEATGQAILDYLRSNTSEAVELAVAVDKPKFSQENADELNIKDILGTGHSNMAGSSFDRRKNIERGIELLNGLLIAPGEEFSLLEALQPFTLENGYVAELVIKGNETLPEIGGGLCQIGTTTFRGAMYSGLDISERRNHSYAVSYYVDDRNGLPGTDATIYEGSPDFKFFNDTPGYILLQTRLDGNDLYFDFWGTDDGRQADFTEPTISGWIAPPETKIIETTDLAPGQRRCTEVAHRGTTASFDYIVNYADGSKREETFSSTYKPWQAVCLVGVEPEAELEEEETASEDAHVDTTEEPSDKKKKKD